MNNIRAKFAVSSVLQKSNGEEVTLHAVYSADPTTENYSFSAATPSGELRLYISNPAVFGAFSRGEEFYVDLTKCSAE